VFFVESTNEIKLDDQLKLLNEKTFSCPLLAQSGIKFHLFQSVQMEEKV
jgi:hypothetical protein